MKLSILIPAYNPGKWLRGIMDSLQEQIEKYQMTEIIVVDDGSTEDLSYVAEYPNTLLWRKGNGGESSARNVCLALAQGEYIQFVDSDDVIYGNFLSVIYDNIEQGYDYVSYEFDTDHDRNRSYHNYGQMLINCALWGYTLKADLVEGEKFDETMLTGCDVDFLLRVLPRGEKHKHDERVIYNYRWDGNENSLCHKKLRGEI